MTILRSFAHSLRLFLLNKLGGNQPAASAQQANILDSYVLSEPSDQNILDIFEGEWSSALPETVGLETQPGFAEVFEDGRITWAEEVFGGFSGKGILELGPLEAGHSYMMHERGAAKITSIEANSRAFLKCLCIKEILHLERVDFQLGDFMAYLKTSDARYDIAIASGVLYHMEEPIELIQLLSNASDQLLLWTHYYDQEILDAQPTSTRRFTELRTGSHDGFEYEYVTQAYNEALNWVGFCGGPKTQSKWLTRESLISALEHVGFTELEFSFDDANHPNGPALAICAQR